MRQGKDVLYATVTEKSFQQQVIEIARLHHYDLIYHTWSSVHSAPGFPDLILIRRSPWPADLLVRELKTEKGKVTLYQKEWLAGWQANGVDADILRPSGLDAFIARLQRTS